MEPVDLGFLEPVVAAELALVGGVAVRVEEVERHCGVARGAAREDLVVVVSDAVDAGGAGFAKGEGQGLGEGHEGGAGEGAFVVVVAEDEGVGDGAVDEELGELEDGGLGVRRGFAIDLVAGEDDEVGFFAVKDELDEIEGAGVGVAFAAVVGEGFGVPADAEAGGKVQVGDLEDLEFAVFVDAKRRFFDWRWWPTTDAKASFLVVPRI